MSSKLFVAIAIVPRDSLFFDRAVHALELTVGPWVVWLGQAMLGAIETAGILTVSAAGPALQAGPDCGFRRPEVAGFLSNLAR